MSKWHKPSNPKARGRDVTWLMARDGTDCMLCGRPLDRSIKDDRHPMCITFDHITPRSKGGADTLANQRLAHRECNELRGNDPCVPLEGEVVVD